MRPVETDSHDSIGVGGEYPSSSTSAAEAANEKVPKNRGPVTHKFP